MRKLPQEIIENGIHYRLIGDYYFPDFTTPDEMGFLGKWADLHLSYMKEHRHKAYAEMLFADTLVGYLREFQQQAEERYQRIVEEMKVADSVTEALKERNQMEWVRRMNGIAAQAEEIVMSEMVYK